MAQIFELSEIRGALARIDVVTRIEEGFVAYSRGDVVVPPVADLVLTDPPGEVHIKYGYIRNDNYYVIKIASGFYGNVLLGLPTGNGLMLLFKQQTGELAGILLDEGYLTDVRTAAAGAVVAKYLAPGDVQRIGIVGAGVQGRLQLRYLKSVLDCRDVLVWGLNQNELNAYSEEMSQLGFDVKTTLDSDEVASSCNYIVTATPSTKPLLKAELIHEGTHITAVGSDMPEKIELESQILSKADIVVADSIEQCMVRGEIYRAIKAGVINNEKPVELGKVIVDKRLRRSSGKQITVADLTGVAVQDIQISNAIFEELANG